MASVDSILANAQSYASQLSSAATAAVSQTLTAVAAVADPEVPTFDIPTYTVAQFSYVPLGALNAPSLEMPPEPNATIAFQPISPIITGQTPTFLVPTPSLTLPNKPGQVSDWVGTPPPIDTSFVFPTAPALLTNPLPSMPTMAAHDTPEAPTYALPSLDQNVPTVTPSATVSDTAFQAGYADASPQFISMMNGQIDGMLAKTNPRYAEQMAAVEAQLSTYLAGGTGLSPTVETAIYGRSRAKVDEETMRMRAQALNEAATRGFTLPNGALMSALQQARLAGAGNNAKAATEITVMRAEMEQKNLQFAVTTSAGLRTSVLNAMMNYMQGIVSINGQALDYGKQALGNLIEAYNTKAKAFTLTLDVHRAAVGAYEARMKGAQLTAEIYKTEVGALEALVNVDRAKVEAFKAQIDSINVVAGVYKTQIDATLGKATLEKIKLDLFQTQVQVFSAQVQAKNAEWQGYTAAIGGEESKVRMYAAQVETYKAQIDGFKANIEAQAETVKAQAASNQALASQAAAQVAVFEAVVKGRATAAGFEIEHSKLLVANHQAEMQAAIGKTDAAVRYAVGMSGVAVEPAKLQLMANAEQFKANTARMQTIAGVSTITATTLGGMAQAAMAGMNVLAAQTETL